MSAPTPICATCGCSLVRLGITGATATTRTHAGEQLLFCCDGCAELFAEQPDAYLAELRDWVVCPVCLGEKPKALTVAIEHHGVTVHLCRCPGCLTAFRADAEALLRRLAA